MSFFVFVISLRVIFPFLTISRQRGPVYLADEGTVLFAFLLIFIISPIKQKDAFFGTFRIEILFWIDGLVWLKEYDFDARMAELKEEEERAKEYRRDKKKVRHMFILGPSPLDIRLIYVGQDEFFYPSVGHQRRLISFLP